MQIILIYIEIKKWYITDLGVARGAKASQLAKVILQLDENAEVRCFESVAQAIKAADSEAQQGDRVIVFGSFYTVEFAMQLGI